MAGWREDIGIGRHLLLSKVSVYTTLMHVIFIASCISFPATSYGQPGFLSVDCGYTGPNYTDPNTQLTWTGDYDFGGDAGESYEQPALHSADAGSRWLQSFRFFPEPRNKYCYELPTTIDTSYLIRASFYLNETVLKERQPFQFILYLDGTNWFTLTSGDDSISDLSAVQEVIFQPPNNITNFCMQPVLGVPFISSLELRELDNAKYNYSGDGGEYLALLFRYNLGTNSTSTAVRFPVDKFDRIWQPCTLTSNYSDLQQLSTISTTKPPDNNTRANANFVPPKVMQDGWITNTSSQLLTTFLLYSQYLPVYMTPSRILFALIYIENLNNTDLDYPVETNFNGNVNYANFTDQDTMSEFTDQATIIEGMVILSSNTISLDLFGIDPNEHPVGLTMNAVEVYGRYSYNLSFTYQDDVDAISALKKYLNMNDSRGDPCTPVPYDWLSCVIGDYNVNLFSDYSPFEKPCGSNGTSMTYCEDEQGNTNSQFDVSAINIHNASNVNEGLYLFIESQNIGWLPSLATLSITQSEITSETMQNLLSNFTLDRSVSKMDFSYNSIEYIKCSYCDNGIFSSSSLTSVNFSHNQISSVLNTFVGPQLEILDLSYNELTSIPAIWNNYFSNLTFLELSHNQLQGKISSLDQVIQMSNDSLQELYLSYNNLDGSFSSSLYFSVIRNLKIGFFDQNNIQGTLDLSMWYDTLQKVEGFQNSTPNIVSPTVIRQLFSFVNNNISDISPNAETLYPVLDMVMKKHNSTSFGILLGGNPYCNSALSYAQQYLCRSTINQSIPAPNPETQQSHNQTEIILIVAICGGIIALLITGVTSATLWKLWRQVYSLREVQQALAERKVQPPFYLYNDLKLATKDFHKDYKLGHGGYGAVYKAGLVDGTKVAVKKLFNSKGPRAHEDLDEFLNEVVLITGIKHRNLVQLKGCCIKDKERLLVYEFADKGNLAEALWGKLHAITPTENFDNYYTYIWPYTYMVSKA